MKNKLKKKTKINNIVFPHPQHPLFDLQQISSLQVAKPSHSNNHRKLSRSNSKDQSQKQSFRSLSLGYKQINSLPSCSKKTIPIFEHKQKGEREKKSLKRKTNINSAAEISSFFFKGMEKNLIKQCQQVLSMQKPRRSQSSCQLQSLASNIFLLQQKNSDAGINLKKSTTVHQISTQKTDQQIEIIPISLMKIESESNSSEEDNVSAIDRQIEPITGIDISQAQLASIKRIQESWHSKNSELMEHKGLMGSQKSLVSSQTRYQKMCSTLVNSKAHLISSKVKNKTGGLLVVTKIELVSKLHMELSIFFQILSEIVYKKIISVSEKRSTDLRIKKNHTNRIQHFRQKSRDKIFTHLNKKALFSSLTPFYEDLLAYIEQYMIFQRTYKGLLLIDQDQSDFFNNNRDQAKDYFFYFIQKLGSTFYLVKTSYDASKGINFTFLCDFTTLSVGDQLIFPYTSPPCRSKIPKSKLILVKAAEEFAEAAEQQWSKKQFCQNQLSAEIGKMSIKSLQKLTDQDSLLSWNINKKFEMIGNTTNFFQLHDHFDLGFFNRNQSFFKSGSFYYTLPKNKPIYFYSFPHHYQFIKLNQLEKQALVIAHLPPLTDTVKYKALPSFYNRLNLKKFNKNINTVILYLKKLKIQIQVTHQVQLVLTSTYNQRSHKLTLSRKECFFGLRELTINQVSQSVENTLRNYRLQPFFLYKKYQPIYQPEVLMYYKSIHKLEGHFIFVSLYKLIKIGIVQFKIYTFQFGRTFVIRLETEDISSDSIDFTVINLLDIFKSIYFKKVLQYEVRRSQKRRKEALSDFLKHQIKFNPTNIRVKRKNQNELRKKNMLKLATLRSAADSNPIYENVMSKLCKTFNGKNCYFTLCYLPVKQIKECKDLMHEKIEICLYFADNISYFRYISNIKDLTSAIAPEWRGTDELDSKQILYVYKAISQNILRIINTTSGTFNFIAARLKHFFNPKTLQRNISYHPFVFKMIGKNLFQTKEEVTFGNKAVSRMSIDLNIPRENSITSFNFIEEADLFQSQLRLPLPSIGKGMGKTSKATTLTYLVDIAQEWLIEVVDIYNPNQSYRFQGGLIAKQRQIRLVDRQSQRCLMLGEWQGDFVSTIKYSQFNKRMLRRLLKGVRSSL